MADNGSSEATRASSLTTPSGGPSKSTPLSLAKDNESWQTHPLYTTLSSRLSALENQVRAKDSEIRTLTKKVESLEYQLRQPQSAFSAFPSLVTPQSQPIFSPFEGPDPARPSPFIPVPTNSATSPSSDIAVLTQQLSALSTSVAQLQKLQQLNRPTNGSTPGRSSGGMPLHLPSGAIRPPFNGDGYLNTGPLTAPGGTGRPGMGRSMSSNVVGEGEKWGGLGSRALAGVTPGGSGRDWSAVSAGNGVMSPGPGVGAAAPGAGIVVTKWEHLNLKADLLRSIVKYA
jgi:hypothetical protein